jgi:hypothetical protein
LTQNVCKKLDLPKNIGKKLQICKISKLQVFVITNICKPIFVTFGWIGTRGEFFKEIFAPSPNRRLAEICA